MVTCQNNKRGKLKQYIDHTFTLYINIVECVVCMCRTAFGYHAGPTVNISFFIKTKTMNEYDRERERERKKTNTLTNCTMNVIKVNSISCIALILQIFY